MKTKVEAIQDELNKFSLLLERVPLEQQDDLKHKLVSTMTEEYKLLLEKVYRMLGYDAVISIQVIDIHKLE